jgi:hypothetical protein
MVEQTLVSRSLRLKDLFGHVTRAEKKKKGSGNPSDAEVVVLLPNQQGTT